MLKKQRSLGPVVVVDAGLSLAPVRPIPGVAELEQRRIKAELVARAWTKGGIDAVAFGTNDWMLGAEFLRGLVADRGLPLLAANLSCGGTRPYPGGKVVEAGGRNIGIVGVTAGTVDGCEVGPVLPAIETAVAELGAVDVVVGLVPFQHDREVGALQGRLPVDLVIDARGRFPQAGTERKADTWFVGAGSRGKVVSRLELEFVPGGEGWAAEGEGQRIAKQIELTKTRIGALDGRIAQAPDEAARTRLEGQRRTYEKALADLEAAYARGHDDEGTNRFDVTEVTLDDQIADDPEVGAMIALAKAKITTTSGGDPAKFVPRTVVDAGSPFAGGEACVGCHREQHGQWSTTRHARAWMTLVQADRAFDDDCWTCHVTGAGAAGGPPSAPDSGPWRDVQCEACHGPARAHVAAPAEVKPVRSPAIETCTVCHDGRQDAGRFDPSTYLPKVRHDALP